MISLGVQEGKETPEQPLSTENRSEIYKTGGGGADEQKKKRKDANEWREKRLTVDVCGDVDTPESHHSNNKAEGVFVPAFGFWVGAGHGKRALDAGKERAMLADGKPLAHVEGLALFGNNKVCAHNPETL